MLSMVLKAGMVPLDTGNKTRGVGLQWEEESELRLLLPRPLRFSQSSCAADLLQNTHSLPVLQQGVTEGPQNQQRGVVLLQCSSAVLFQPQLSSSCTPQSSADNRDVRSP